MIVRHRAAAGPFSSELHRTLDRSFDRTFDQLTSGLFPPRRRFPEVEARWDDDTLVLVVDVPGVPADAVSVDVAGRSLTLGARTESLEWSRSLQLGTSLDPAKVSARHLDGRLTVRIGAVDTPEARSIAIDTNAPATELEGGGDAIEASERSEAVPSGETGGDQSSDTSSTG